jgi:hypothetical protein
MVQGPREENQSRTDSQAQTLLRYSPELPDESSPVFDGNVGGLVAHLLKNERMSRDELDALHRLIDQPQQD